MLRLTSLASELFLEQRVVSELPRANARVLEQVAAVGTNTQARNGKQETA